jgi:hypothetical protein
MLLDQLAEASNQQRSSPSHPTTGHRALYHPHYGTMIAMRCYQFQVLHQRLVSQTALQLGAYQTSSESMQIRHQLDQRQLHQ